MRTIGRAVAVAVAVALLASGCGDDASDGARGSEGADGPARVVVTTPVLGAVVRDVVGEAAPVEVLMPEGVDPHDWEPSAKDIERLRSADLVVTNGLGLEETLDDALADASAEGVVVFAAGDHVDVRRVAEGDIAAEDRHEGDEHQEDEHGVGTEDPHLWLDPLSMERVVAGLAPVLADAGVDVAGRADSVAADLRALHLEVDEALAGVPAERRKLVTGHESFGYFADRYGFDLVGAVIPSVSTQAEASAGELADLEEAIRAAGVPAIFTEVGTPGDVTEAIADEAGVRVVELASHTLPADGTYRSFILDNARAIAGGLEG